MIPFSLENQNFRNLTKRSVPPINRKINTKFIEAKLINKKNFKNIEYIYTITDIWSRKE